MPADRELEYINRIREYGVLDSGQPSFLREWEPVRFLGKGSYGRVYEIRRGNERCAVKIIDMGTHPDLDYSVEINALRMLRGQKHAANIYEYAYVSIVNGSFTDRFLLIRMNLLRDMPKDRNFTEDEAAALAEQMCEILSVCHSGEDKIYHCDIKPENILQAGDGSYVLCDFGASNITQRSHKSSGHAGTPLYESPEMLRFRSFDGRSDLFSLGITMYALLNNGLPPFAKNNNDADAVRVRLDGKKAIPAIPGVSADLMKIIRKACAFDADKRYRSAEEMRKALLAVIRERMGQRNSVGESEDNLYARTNVPGENKAPAPAQKTKRKPFGIIATAAALVAAIVAGVIFIPGSGGKKDGAKDSAVSDSSVVSGSSAVSTVNITELSADTAVGDHVYFGSYPQTAYDEVQPIEWRVLDIQDGAALMISEYLLDDVTYNKNETAVTWETCTLRGWLNNDFYNTAFSDSEKGRIQTVHNKNPDNPSYGTEGGNDTDDNVFCLSIDEAEKYFISDRDRMAAPTEYAVKRGAWTAYTTLDNGMKAGWWWLRSHGNVSNIAASVNANGFINDGGFNVDNDDGSVRPVVLVSLSEGTAVNSEEDSSAVSTVNITELSADTAVGDHVYFGSYPQTADGEVQPIEWRVLDVQDGKALMISEYLLDAQRFDNDNNDWESSEIRAWLNDGFLNKAFSAEEQNKLNGINGDKVSLLTIDEAEKYFSSATDRMAAPTEYAIKHGAITSDKHTLNNGMKTGWWWLRSPGSDSRDAAGVGSYGDIYEGGYVIFDDTCVRLVVLASL